MDLIKLLKKQEGLDLVIFNNAGIKEYPKENIKLALLTELGELANEWQGFKHWKKNKIIDKEKMLSEFADCLHFALSLENNLKQLDKESLQNFDYIVRKIDAQAKSSTLEDDKIYGFIATYKTVIEEDIPLLGIITLGLCLNITLDEMEEFYLKKHNINYQRQESGY